MIGYLRIDRYTTPIARVELRGGRIHFFGAPVIAEGAFSGPIFLIGMDREVIVEGTEILDFDNVHRGDQIEIAYSVEPTGLVVMDGTVG